MSETNVGVLIKWALIIFVIVIVGIGLYLVFRDQILGFFESLPTGIKDNLSSGVKLILSCLKI